MANSAGIEPPGAWGLLSKPAKERLLRCVCGRTMASQIGVANGIVWICQCGRRHGEIGVDMEALLRRIDSLESRLAEVERSKR